MRFRRLEDEQRYHALRTELYLRIAKALGSQPELCTEILRNLGKIEHLAFYEGVDQGAAAAVLGITTAGDQSVVGAESSPADLHRALYGHQDTPLADVEALVWEAALPETPMPPILRAERAEYAPLTLQEALDAGAAAPAVAAPQDATVAHEGPSDAETGGALRWELERLRLDGMYDAAVAELGGELPDVASAADPDRDASPEKLDAIREALIGRTSKGWKPTEWAELVVAVMEDTQLPAYLIDQQLDTPQGEAVLSQAGLLDIAASPWGSIPMGALPPGLVQALGNRAEVVVSGSDENAGDTASEAP
ncbi:MAG TPA: hypothetical protein VIY27_08275 [Myxococcota bacterium]